MLNSAAGVMFPSAIAPPIRTIRAGRMPRSSASATFVSGPTGTSTVSGADVLDEEVDGVLLDRLGGARRQLGPVQAALAVDVRGDVELAHERPVGAHRDRNVLAADELEHPQRVVGRLLERLVAVDGGDADELDLGAREREQQRDRVVVPGVAVEDDRRASPGEYRVHLGRGRERGLRAEARGGDRPGGAGAAQRLFAGRGPRAARRAGRR